MEIDLKEFIESQIAGIRSDLVDFKKENKEGHAELLEHQKYTNGKVRRLEIWRAGIIGALGVIMFIIPIVGWVIKIEMDGFNNGIDNRTKVIVVDAINQNNDKYFVK